MVTGDFLSLLGAGQQNLTDYYSGIQQQAVAQNIYQTFTTSAGSSAGITLNLLPDYTQPAVKAAEPEEVAWLKRRVREIEWRP